LLPWKGLALAIAAIAEPNASDWHLHIYGDGPDYARCARLANRLGVGQRVVFHGSRPRDEVLDAIAAADAFLFPSMHDAAGWAVAEAVARGTPVVCLDRGGPAVLACGDGCVRVAAADASPRTLANALTRCFRHAPSTVWSEARLPALLSSWYALAAGPERAARLLPAAPREPEHSPAQAERAARGAPPLVSVIIPAFNASRYLGEAIESVLRQTYVPIELIVVDDGSTDDALAVARRYECERVRVLTGPNQGPGAARNRGLAQCSGAYVAFLDADDVWMEDKIARQVEYLKAHPGAAVVGCLMRYTGEDGRIGGVSGEPRAAELRERVAAGRLMPFALSSALFRAADVRHVGGFDTLIPRNAPFEDFDLVAKIADRREIAMIPHILGYYRVHAENASFRHAARQRQGARFVRARIRARREGSDLTWDEFSRSYRLSWNQRRGDLGQLLYRRAGQFYVAGRRARSALLALAAFALSPLYFSRRLVSQFSEGSR
jgi:glycosyltransferase involved in cell wall biosynthesis